MKQLRIMGISGSLRANSSATMVLKQIGTLLPSSVEFNIYDGLAELPHFNDAADEPGTVKRFKNLVAAADGIFICSPEYAFGVPGSLKNALDWTVSSGDFVNKPVALITAASGGKNAHASLLLTLSALSASVEEEATLIIPFIRAKLNEAGELKDAATLTQVKNLISSFVSIIEQRNA